MGGIGGPLPGDGTSHLKLLSHLAGHQLVGADSPRRVRAVVLLAFCTDSFRGLLQARDYFWWELCTSPLLNCFLPRSYSVQVPTSPLIRPWFQWTLLALFKINPIKTFHY